jgi:hypothetical protein
LLEEKTARGRRNQLGVLILIAGLSGMREERKELEGTGGSACEVRFFANLRKSKRFRWINLCDWRGKSAQRTFHSK